MKNEQSVDHEKRLLAAAVFELRVLLSSCLNPDADDAASTAALFANALHNQALATLEGRPFNVAEALEAIDRLEPRLGRRYLQHFRDTVLAPI